MGLLLTTVVTLVLIAMVYKLFEAFFDRQDRIELEREKRKKLLADLNPLTPQQAVSLTDEEYATLKEKVNEISKILSEKIDGDCREYTISKDSLRYEQAVALKDVFECAGWKVFITKSTNFYNYNYKTSWGLTFELPKDVKAETQMLAFKNPSSSNKVRAELPPSTDGQLSAAVVVDDHELGLDSLEKKFLNLEQTMVQQEITPTVTATRNDKKPRTKKARR